ncbi:hypothetical protein FRC18_001383 [Serendipita sp. 400]|nr:hypothetical protein FRC18_001383 [Serendipita sp. 400]
MDEWETNRKYGINRLPSLLRQYNYADIRFKTINAHGDWYLQARSIQGMLSGTDAWDQPWLPEKEFTARHKEIWAILRERICKASDLAQARPGDVFDSTGANTTLRQSYISLTDAHPKVRTGQYGASSSEIKEEEIDPGVFQTDNGDQIDLTGNSPPDSPLQATYPVDAQQAEFISPKSRHTIDLTEIIEVDLTRDEPMEAVTAASATSGIRSSIIEPLPNLDDAIVETQDSERDTLFDGTGSESEFSSVEEAGDQAPPLDHLSTLKMLYANQELILTQQQQIPTVGKKRGRKDALEITNEVKKPASNRIEQIDQRASKRRRVNGPKTGPSLFTAVNGRPMIRERNGQYSEFVPQKSSGSVLAKQRLETLEKAPNSNRESERPTALIPPRLFDTNADDLEDYEEVEEDEIIVPPQQAVVVPLATPPRWADIQRPNSAAVHHLIDMRNRPKFVDTTAPPLFLLRLSRDKTLRLMLQDVSPSRILWYPAFDEHIKPDPDSTAPRIGYGWVKHELHLLTLAPQFHTLPWKESTAKQDILLARINKAVNSSKGASLQAELNLELAKEQKRFWRLGEKEKSVVVPRVGNIAEAERILFTVPLGGTTTLLDRRILGGDRLHAGSWAQLVPYESRSEKPSADNETELEVLIRWMDKQGKFLILHSPTVDAHHQHPYTVIIFSSRSNAIRGLCGLPDSSAFLTSRYGLGIAHLGRQIGNLDHLAELDMGPDGGGVVS